jgi:hypothetical protein
MWLQFFVTARQSVTCATVAFLHSLSCRPTLKRHKHWRETMRRLILFLLHWPCYRFFVRRRQLVIRRAILTP